MLAVLFSFSKLLEQKEQLEQRHLHLLQILDTERQSKWQYVQQTEELATEVRKLKSEVLHVRMSCSFANLCSLQISAYIGVRKINLSGISPANPIQS